MFSLPPRKVLTILPLLYLENLHDNVTKDQEVISIAEIGQIIELVLK